MATEDLKTLLQSVNEAKTVLPEFQRDFVWAPAAVIKLMTSIFNGYPIGSLLTMENSGAYQSRTIDGVKSDKSDNTIEQVLVLDGQQRVTSCYRAFFGTLDQKFKNPGRYYFDYKAYVAARMAGEKPDGSTIEEFFEFLRPTKVKKRYNSLAAEISHGLMPLDIILQEPRGYSYAKWLGQYNFSESNGDSDKYEQLGNISADFQTKFIERVTGYQVNYEKITRDTNPDVICTIFETINTTGVKLTVFDLLVAKCFKSKIYLRDMLDKAILSNEWISHFDPEGKQIAVVQLPRILGQLITKECKKGVILSLDATDIANYWQKAVYGLNKALETLYKRYGVPRSEFIPSTDVITPLAVILADGRFSDSMLQDLDIWYWRVVFGQYLRGAPETKIARTVREIQGPNGWLSGGNIEPDAVKNFQFRPSEIDDATKNQIVYKGLFTLMLARRPFDIGSDRRSLRDIPCDEIHDHHIFPQKFLYDNGIKGVKANQILNRMPIWKATNERVSSFAPSVYCSDNELTHDQLEKDLEYFYGIDVQDLVKTFSREDYDVFLFSRKDCFLDMIAAAVRSNRADMIVSEDI